MSGQTFTENGAPSFASSGDARVNLFCKLSRDAHENPSFVQWIDDAWAESPADTMKLLFHDRDCRGGKGDRTTFLKAMVRIAERYPETFMVNLPHMPEYGRYSDWFELVEYLAKQDHVLFDIIVRKVAMLTVKQLKEDMCNMQEGKPVSLLAKWVPTEGKRLNRKSHVLNYIITLLLDVDFLVRPHHFKEFRKSYISPLRAYLNVVENYMCSGRFDAIDYSAVPSVAMHRLKNAFARNDTERFLAWQDALCNGTTKVNAGQLYPHNLVSEYLDKPYESPDIVVEEQWKALLKYVAEHGSLADSLVLSDVSGSMKGVPMTVSIALGILISQLSCEPFKNSIITFDTHPQFCKIPESHTTLFDAVHHVRKMPWGGSTDLHAVFKLILDKAVANGLAPSSMPKRLYILSDMQFDSAFGDIALSAIDAMYHECGYMRPQIVFWNLRSNTTFDFPAHYAENDVALVSGFSPAILKVLLQGDMLTPYSVMRQTIDNPRYDRISVSAFL